MTINKYGWRLDRFHSLMEKANITFGNLADACGVSEAALVSYSQSKSSPSIDSLAKIADFFAVPVDYLLGRLDDEALVKDYSEYFMMLRRAPYEAYLSGGRKVLRMTTGEIEAPWPYNLLDDVLKYTGKKWEVVLSPDQEKGLDHAIELLGKREGQMLREYYEGGKTLDEIATTNGISRERVRQIVSKGVRRLRHPVLFHLIELGADGSEQARGLTKAAEELRTKIQAVNDMEVELRAKMSQLGTLMALAPQGSVELDTKMPRKSYDMSVDELDLSVRSWNCLRRADIKTIGDACKAARAGSLLKMRNLGRKSLEEIVTKLELYTGEDFTEEREEWGI